MIKTYKPRTTAADMPSNDNKFFIRKQDGGYSPCIKGYPEHAHLTALSNCVAWAVGRTMEITGSTTNIIPNLNAEDIYNNSKLEKGAIPKNGAVACWKQGSLWNGNDGCGHVAVVEKVISGEEIITSESAYGGMCFYTKTRKKGTGNWGAGSNFKFLGFLYLPDDYEPEEFKKEFKVGDIVTFNGGYHYGSANATTASGGLRTKGEAKITVMSPNALHPYHLIGTKGSNVYGWVDKDTISENCEIKIGDVVMIEKDAPIYGTNNKFASWVYERKLFVREINKDRIVISIYDSGAITGAVDRKYLIKSK